MSLRYELTGGFIKNAILSALSIAVSRDGDNPLITQSDLLKGASLQLRGRLRMKVCAYVCVHVCVCVCGCACMCVCVCVGVCRDNYNSLSSDICQANWVVWQPKIIWSVKVYSLFNNIVDTFHTSVLGLNAK